MKNSNNKDLKKVKVHLPLSVKEIIQQMVKNFYVNQGIVSYGDLEQVYKFTKYGLNHIIIKFMNRNSDRQNLELSGYGYGKRHDSPLFSTFVTEELIEEGKRLRLEYHKVVKKEITFNDYILACFISDRYIDERTTIMTSIPFEKMFELKRASRKTNSITRRGNK